MVELPEKQIKENYFRIKDSIDTIAQQAGRDPEAIKLVVVTKGHSLRTINAVLDAGARDLGENYVEEAIAKIERVSIAGVTWHMIGHIQSRKTRNVATYFDWVHSLDRMKIINRLENALGNLDKSIPGLLECNLSGEESKFGYALWDKESWPSFANELAKLNELSHLRITGLMTMPPYADDPEYSRQYFVKLNQLRDFLMKHVPALNLTELSMGMSHDYHVAIQEGATIVRIGTAIVGSRF